MRPMSSPFRNRKFLVFFLLPLAVVALYLLFVAREKYESTAAFVIRDASAQKTLGLDLGLLGAAASSDAKDAGIVEAYLTSHAMLEKIDGKFGLLAVYRSGETDPLERLGEEATREEFLELYLKNLKVVFDEIAGITTLTFRDTSPERARDVLVFMLEESEAFLNRLNADNAEKELAFVRTQMEKSRGELEQRYEKVETFQNDHNLFNPEVQAKSTLELIAVLEARRVEKEAAYREMAAYMRPDAYEMKRKKSELEELERSLEKLRASLSGEEKERLNTLLFQYEKLKGEAQFASEVYKNALIAYETAKVEAGKKAKNLETVVTPHLPQDHVYPKRLRLLLTAALLLALVYGIATLTLAIIKDHRD